MGFHCIYIFTYLHWKEKIKCNGDEMSEDCEEGRKYKGELVLQELAGWA